MEEAISNTYLAAWGTPVAEACPCGEDCGFSTEFEALRAEVEKDASLHADETTDWAKVAQLASSFLAGQSKDIWALAYAVYAEYRLNGIKACPLALAALSHILREWWPQLYPPATRQQRRLAPLVWLCGRFEHAAETTSFMEGSSEEVSALRRQFELLQAVLNEKVGEDAPVFSGIFAKIPASGQLPSSSGEAGAETGREAAPGQTPNSFTPAAQANTRQNANFAEQDKDWRIPPKVFPQVIRHVIDYTQQLAEHFLAANPTDERAFQLRRVGLWGTLSQLPIADQQGKTQLSSGIPAEKIQEYSAAVEGKRYAEILPSLERAAGKSPFWLDGHVMVLNCLIGLDAANAAACLRVSLASLLGRFPELLSYRFKDGTPFVSKKSLTVLEGLRASTSEKNMGAAAYSLQSASVDAEMEELLKKAVELGGKAGFQAGLQQLGTVQAGRNRGAVLHGLLQAQYCISMGNRNAAVRLLGAIYSQLEEWKLLDWEPELTARILALLLATNFGQRNIAPDKVEEMTRHLHWLNLLTALNVVQEH